MTTRIIQRVRARITTGIEGCCIPPRCVARVRQPEGVGSPSRLAGQAHQRSLSCVVILAQTLSALVLVLLVPAALAFDAAGTRQTTGIYIKVEGRGHSIFFDYPSTLAGEGGTFDVPTVFNADLEVWVEGEKLKPGQHRWQFRVEGADRWTIGRVPKNRRDKPTRYLFNVRKVAASREWLTAVFTPDPAGDAVLLTVMLGDREGTLRVLLRAAPAAAPAGDQLDARQLERERDSLLRVAAEIEELRLRRHLWSTLLTTMGDEMLSVPGTAWIDEIDFSRDDEWVKLSIRGHMSGDRAAVEALDERLKAGDVGKAFPIPRTPLSKLPEGGLRSFSLTADVTAPEWRKVTPLAPRHTGRNPQKLGEEILLLEARIAYLAPASVTGLNDGRILLLEAKRRAGALISKILPGAPEEAKSGMGQFDLGFRVGGSGPGLIEFIRVLEDRKEPIRITPVMLRGSTFGPELTLRLTFLSYRPLSIRNPALWAAVNSRGRGPDFDRVRREYIEGIGTAGDRPFAPPTWVRDPFSKPLPEKK